MKFQAEVVALRTAIERLTSRVAGLQQELRALESLSRCEVQAVAVDVRVLESLSDTWEQCWRDIELRTDEQGQQLWHRVSQQSDAVGAAAMVAGGVLEGIADAEQTASPAVSAHAANPAAAAVIPGAGASTGAETSSTGTGRFSIRAIRSLIGGCVAIMVCRAGVKKKC